MPSRPFWGGACPSGGPAPDPRAHRRAGPRGSWAPGPRALSAEQRETRLESEPLDGIRLGPPNFAPTARRGPDLSLCRGFGGGPAGGGRRAGFRGGPERGTPSLRLLPGAGRPSAESGRLRGARRAVRLSPAAPRAPREEPAAVTRQGGNASARRPCREGGSASALGSAPAAGGGSTAEPAVLSNAVTRIHYEVFP
ncbi:translation initiation factor IF-2-like isoform X1 [Camelus ferus]|uniref:Translation initiation factor IF-2-like isoform X1 n=1 Tax=Camelus ferus TaxID=419612 RepID=A0A8B8S8B0_CAMFR|nr:translation initiation factor IF-2-like isoform X1 [Camelus ferus]